MIPPCRRAIDSGSTRGRWRLRRRESYWSTDVAFGCRGCSVRTFVSWGEGVCGAIRGCCRCVGRGWGGRGDINLNQRGGPLVGYRGGGRTDQECRGWLVVFCRIRCSVAIRVSFEREAAAAAAASDSWVSEHFDDTSQSVPPARSKQLELYV